MELSLRFTVTAKLCSGGKFLSPNFTGFLFAPQAKPTHQRFTFAWKYFRPKLWTLQSPKFLLQISFISIKTFPDETRRALKIQPENRKKLFEPANWNFPGLSPRSLAVIDDFLDQLDIRIIISNWRGSFHARFEVFLEKFGLICCVRCLSHLPAPFKCAGRARVIESLRCWPASLRLVGGMTRSPQ